MLILRGIKLTTALAAFALFFLPWIDIQCSNKSLATQTGIQTITGKATPSKEMEAKQAHGAGQEDSLGSAGMVAAALLATGLAIACLLVALINDKPKLDGAGSVLCALALLLLVAQVIQGFPAKDEVISSVSTDQASNEFDMASSLAIKMAASIQVQVLPAFIITCVLLGIPVLLMLSQLLARLGVVKSGTTSLLLVICLVGCDRADLSEDSREVIGVKENTPKANESHAGAGEWLIQKVDAIVIPNANFEDTTIEDAIEFVRMRAAELDPEPDPTKRGISFVVRAKEEVPEESSDEGLESALGDLNHNFNKRKLINLREKNIKVSELLVKCAEQVDLDFYLTSRGWLMLPEGERPDEDVEIWKIYRETKK